MTGPQPNDGDALEWYGVRHILMSDTNTPWGSRDLTPGVADYEERITLWKASSADEAMRLAEEEAREHADVLEEHLLDFFQAFRMFDSPTSRAEVFSLIRRSGLEPDEYISHFFDTGRENGTRSEG